MSDIKDKELAIKQMDKAIKKNLKLQLENEQLKVANLILKNKVKQNDENVLHLIKEFKSINKIGE